MSNLVPEIIFTCVECCTEIMRLKGDLTLTDRLCRNVCFDCYQRFKDVEWKYKELCK